MESSDVITLIGIGLTFLVSLVTLIYTIKRNKHSDFISKVTDYRLKWIDLVRIPISEYLFSVDRMGRGNEEATSENYTLFLAKHWQMQAFLTTFSPNDKKAQEVLDKIYKNASLLLSANCADKEKARKSIIEDLTTANKTLRELMDENWFKVKDEVD